MPADILIVDDEEDIRSLIRGILEDEGYTCREAAHAKGAYAAIEEKSPDLAILDIWLQDSDEDGMAILERLKAEKPQVPVIMISGHGTIETAVHSIKQGAYDFIEKPFKSDRLLLMVERALETSSLRQENEALKEEIVGPADMVGTSNALKSVQQIIDRVAQTNSRVLITGEAGCGKNIAAHSLHRCSGRKNGPFVSLNCAILHPERLEIELFGAENQEGQITQQGALERADGGTLLLDEVADMPLETQGKIVRVLQEQFFQRVGGHDLIKVDVRILASTNRDLEQAIEEGQFRQDLYYRLNVVPIKIPQLSERMQDIPLLVDHFVELHSRQSGLPKKSFSEDALIALQNYDWPGNIRQLRNVVEWVMIMSGDKEIHQAQLPPDITGGDTPSQTGYVSQNNLMALSLKQARESFERDYLLSQIQRFGGNISKTAQFVGMERSALHRKLKSLDISATDKQDNKDEDLGTIKQKRA